MLTEIVAKAKGLPLPAKVIAGAMAALLLYLAADAVGGIAWARVVSNRALRGIASTISDIDRVEQDSAAKEQELEKKDEAIRALAKQAQAEHDARVQTQQREAAKQAEVATARGEVAELRRQLAAMPAVTSLDQAAAVINRAVGR